MSDIEAQAMWKVARRISHVTGVILGEAQESLVRNRLSKRMRALGQATFAEYERHVAGHPDELDQAISLLTTHHTFFFREFRQFEAMLGPQLESLIARVRASGRKELRIWSAACSYGHEAYSLAMFFDHHLSRIAPDLSVRVFGSDVCSESVTLAREGLYPWDQLREVPVAYLEKHWSIELSGEQAGARRMARVKPDLGSRCQFAPLNLLQLPIDAFGGGKFDLIVCRNVFIYFDEPTIERAVRGLLERLEPHGYLFLGLSESLSRTPPGLKHLGRSVYSSVTQPEPKPEAPKRLLRVACIDDSPTVLSILERVLTPEEGFEIVGSAANGAEGTELVARTRPDVVTLDLHMPVMGGVDYLRQRQRPGSAPVVVVSSVSREDAGLALEALRLGASDYVEKPALKDLHLKADELRSKLRMALARDAAAATPRRALDEAAGRSPVIGETDSKLRVVTCSPGDVESTRELLAKLIAPQPATLVAVDGLSTLGPALAARLAEGTALRVLSADAAPASPERNTIYVCPHDDATYALAARLSRKTCQLVVGPIADAARARVLALTGSRVIAQELAQGSGRSLSYRNEATDVVPLASMAYESDKFFAGMGVDTDADSAVALEEKAEQSARAESRAREFTVGEGELLVALAGQGRVRAVKDTAEAVERLVARLLEGGGEHGARWIEEAKLVVGYRSSSTRLEKLLEKAGITRQAIYRSKEGALAARLWSGTARVQVRPNAVAPAADAAPAPAPKKLRVLLVDDSASIRALLKRVIDSHPSLEVVAEASKPSEVASLIETQRPDVMTLDVFMPEMTGTELLARLPSRLSIPTVMISSLNPGESTEVLRALELGAFDFIQKPAMNELASAATRIQETLLGAAAAKGRKATAAVAATGAAAAPFRTSMPILIGASTGGTEAIKDLFATFPAEIPPVLVVQHIPAFFSTAFAKRLDELFPFEVREAVDGDEPRPGLVLIAPGGRQMTLERAGAGKLRVRVSDDPSKALHKPSVDKLFSSAATALDTGAVAVLLTGMGSDGAAGMLELKARGVKTIAQDAASCVVYGMPKAAVERGAVTVQVPLTRIADEIRAYHQKNQP